MPSKAAPPRASAHAPVRLLCMDTSSLLGSAALWEQDHVVVETNWSLPAPRHTECLVPAIEWLLGMAGWSYGDLSCIAVTRGPGSFTGVRVGLSAAKGLALAHDLPVVGLSSLEALAQSAGATWRAPVVPFIDARKHEVYAAIFAPSTDGALERRTDDVVMDPTEFLTAQVPEGPVLLLGSGTTPYRQNITRLLGERATILEAVDGAPRAGLAARVAARRFARGEHVQAARLEATYLRRPEAETSAAGKEKRGA